MLKVKKIMESVIPQSYELSEGEKTAFKEMCNDGAMYYESTCNADRMYCLLCGTVSEVGTEGISWRNNWMINESDTVICYIRYRTGGAYQFVEKARRKGKNIINLFDM